MPSATFNIDESKGELRYFWDDPSLNNPESLENGEILFNLCLTINDGKGMDVPIQITELLVPQFEPLVINGEFEELNFDMTNGLVMIADDCNGIAVLPESICENSIFTVSVDLSASGLSISNFGYWEIDGEIVEQSYEGENFPNNNSNIFISEVNSLFDTDYKEELKVSFLDAESHSFQYFYDFINCAGNTEIFTLQASAQPDPIDTEIPPFICYNEDLIIDLNINQDGMFDLLFSINGIDSVQTISTDNDSLVFLNLVSNLQLGFSVLTNVESNCILSDLSPSDTLITVYDEFKINLIDSTCNDDGSFDASYELIGGSGDFELISDSNGTLTGNNYNTDLIDADELDTVIISDEFCQETSLTFIPQVQCSCIDSVTVFDLDVLIECSSGIIIPEIEKSFTSPIEDPVTYFRIYSKDNMGEIEEVIFDTLVYNESNPEIPYSSLYENGRTYFARPILSERLNGIIDLNYRCLSVGQEIRFRYYKDPVPEILGEEIVCTNQQDVKYSVSTDNNVNDFVWTDPIGATGFQLGNSFYITYSSESPVNLEVTETYIPLDIAGDIECIGSDFITVEVTDEEAPKEIEIILFPGGLFSANTDQDLCFQWMSIDKNTGITNEVGSTEKEWIVRQDIDTVNLIYVCIISNPQNGACETSNCATFNYFNSAGPVSTNEYKIDDTKIYPNPTSGDVCLKNDSFKGNEIIKVYSSLGNEISCEYNYMNDYILDCSILEKGTYFISIISPSNNDFIILKLIKM